jgi:hypothetical protein
LPIFHHNLRVSRAGIARFGHFNMRAQAAVPSARRTDTATQLALVDVSTR